LCKDYIKVSQVFDEHINGIHNITTKGSLIVEVAVCPSCHPKMYYLHCFVSRRMEIAVLFMQQILTSMHRLVKFIVRRIHHTLQSSFMMKKKFQWNHALHIQLTV